MKIDTLNNVSNSCAPALKGPLAEPGGELEELHPCLEGWMITGKESQPLEEALVREGIDMVLGIAESCRARRPEVEGSKIIRPASKLLG